MARLGLSDSMRSTASVDDNKSFVPPLHCQSPRAKIVYAPSGQHVQMKTFALGLTKPLRYMLVGILVIVLFIVGKQALARSNVISHSQRNAQIERLERSMELLSSDNTKLHMSASRFMQSCEDAHVASSMRSEMLLKKLKSEYDTQIKKQVQEHEHVLSYVKHYHSQQVQQVAETETRLMKLNVSLPLQIIARQTSATWQKYVQTKVGDSSRVMEQQAAHDSLSPANEKLSLFAEETQQHGSNDYKLKSFDQQQKARFLRIYRLILFFSIVSCATAMYAWRYLSNLERKDNETWSIFLKALARLKAFFCSVVIIEDIRASNS
ncbi:uncharacterized protein CCR75_009309 [Bremia lactucae]|uniref:Uncharacterized protein n=1 Tax=Bremia lactucae TaxID=4779 RepID=A0A976FDV7_BRELC|nr:hypothetical protein CCR75_009309 [Bremia lactucae]